MSKALGKGLSALIPEKNTSSRDTSIAFVPTSQVLDNRFQPRTDYNEERLNELKESIREKGLLQPLVVRQVDDNYEVVAGERRLKAARALGLEEIPVIIKKFSDQEVLVIALVENIQREALNPIEEAFAFERLINSFGYSQEEVASSVGKKRSTISNSLRLLKLSDEIQNAVIDQSISMGHARALVGLESKVQQINLLNKIIADQLSVRELESIIRNETQPKEMSKRSSVGVSPKNPQIMALEEGLQKLLGTKVSIESKKKRGRIFIDYYSMEDLDRIIKTIIK